MAFYHVLSIYMETQHLAYKSIPATLNRMLLNFTKMHGLGNDFVVIDGIHQTVDLTADQCRQLADRRFGIGCDQILLVESPRQAQSDFYYRIFNADGSEVEQCGNGARCFARFVRDKGMFNGDDIRVETHSGIIVLHITENGDVTVNMGAPRLAPADIPFDEESQATHYPLDVADKTFSIGAVSMGNPHAVLTVEDIDACDVDGLGNSIESHPRFPQRVNVGFMQILNRQHIRLRVFERGAGETLACGTGACAAVVAGRIQGQLDDKVTVNLPGGDLQISWQGGSEPVWMTGPATHVFEGQIAL